MILSTEIYLLQQGLTYFVLFNFFCSNGKNIEDLDHYCHDRVQHPLTWRHFSVYVQTSEKCFYALKHLKKSVLVRANVLGRLIIICITMDRIIALRLHTERRTANPIKITFAGENTFKHFRGRRSRTSPCSEAYRTDSFFECL